MRRGVLIPLGIQAGCAALASPPWRMRLVLAAGYVLISAGMLWRWHTKADLAFSVVALVLGPLGKAWQCRQGLGLRPTQPARHSPAEDAVKYL